MKASENHFVLIIGRPKQFVIPLFQRPYSWRKPNWETLWNDIEETCALGVDGRHFLGSIVSKSLPADPAGVSGYLVIDGQQRLTTLAILLAAMRDVAIGDGSNLGQKIQSLYLTNEFGSGNARYKVLPTQADRPAFFAIIDSAIAGKDRPRMWQAYDYFTERLFDLWKVGR